MEDFSHLYLPTGVTLVVYIALMLIKKLGISRLKPIAKKTDFYYDDLILSALEQSSHLFIIATAIYIGFHSLKWDPHYQIWANRTFVVILAMQCIKWIRYGVDTWANLTLGKKKNDPGVKMTLGFVGMLLKCLLVILVVLFALNNLGVNVTTFIAGLGIGGVAIALATQRILGDLFASLSIVLDRPFLVGDAISLGEFSGTIERVGLKSTRIKSSSGEQIIISNSDLLASKIRNFKRMNERRVVFKLGVTYQTKREDLKKAPKLIEEIIKAKENVRFDRSHFMNYGSFSLDIETVYIVLKPDYNAYIDTHQEILLEIHEAFEKNNLEFAYPTQVVYLEKGTGEV